MFINKVSRKPYNIYLSIKTYCTNTLSPTDVAARFPKPISSLDDIKDDFSNVPHDCKSVLARCEEDISHVAPYLKPTFNFSAYVNTSATLQELLKLGVQLHKIEKKGNAPQFILGLDFERDVKNHVIFLHERGVSTEDIGQIITRNPYIFRPSLENMKVRINYLESKRFSGEMIARILGKNPFWLMFPTPKIDNRLGFFQKEFSLTGNEVRLLTTKQPKLITFSLQSVKVNKFAITEEMGFSKEETKLILLNKPMIYMKEQNHLLETFTYLHRTMQISTELISKLPGVLTCRLFKLKQRHGFLECIKKVQYDPKQPNYVSLLDLVAGNDSEFCENVAKVPVNLYNNYLKSL